MECTAELYWEDAQGKSYKARIGAYLPGIDRVFQEYTLYGYEEETPNIRSNRFVVTSIRETLSTGKIELKLIEKISYEEAHRIYSDLIEYKK